MQVLDKLAEFSVESSIDISFGVIHQRRTVKHKIFTSETQIIWRFEDKSPPDRIARKRPKRKIWFCVSDVCDSDVCERRGMWASSKRTKLDNMGEGEGGGVIKSVFSRTSSDVFGQTTSDVDVLVEHQLHQMFN